MCVCINLPPLRDRREEIPLLADYLLKKYSVQYNKPCSEISRETMRLFMDYDWPGNIRELENLIKRAVVLGWEEPIRKEMTHGDCNGRAPRALPRGRPFRIGAGSWPPARRGMMAHVAPAGPPTPAEIATAAADAGNYSLKDISRDGSPPSRTRADSQDAPADTLEPEGDRRDPGHQLQGLALQDQGKRTRQGLITP